MSVPFTFSEPYEFDTDMVMDVFHGNKKWVLSAEMRRELPLMHNMELREDDVWLLGYPKCGNTWATEMIYTVYHGGTKEANQAKHFDRWCLPSLSAYERTSLRKMPGGEAKVALVKDRFKETVEKKSPRFLRSHLPLSLLSPKLLDTCKVVYIVRNLKDVATSFFKMVESTGLMGTLNFDEFIEDFMTNRAMFSPVCENIKEAWEQKDHPNMYFLYYEDMKADLPSVMHKMAAFLGKSLNDKQIKELEEHLSVESMRKNTNTNWTELREMGWMGKEGNFIRKGVCGDYKNYFTPAMQEKFEKWISEEMAGSDFKFK